MPQSQERSFYENSDYWKDSRYSSKEQERCLSTIAWIPKDVSSVIDIGCGNGLLTNQISGLNLVIGGDRSFAALQHVRANPIQLSAEALPFANQRFDMVIASEVIEHIPLPNYSSTLQELTRISNKYILITVPYCEDRRILSYRCPACSCSFHVQNHMRSFFEVDLANLFSFEPHITLVRREGLVSQKTPWFRYQLNTIWKWVYRKNRTLPWYAICPQCGYQASSNQSVQQRFEPTNRGPKWFKSIYPHQSTYIWWLALYKRKD